MATITTGMAKTPGPYQTGRAVTACVHGRRGGDCTPPLWAAQHLTRWRLANEVAVGPSLRDPGRSYYGSAHCARRQGGKPGGPRFHMRVPHFNDEPTHRRAIDLLGLEA